MAKLKKSDIAKRLKSTPGWKLTRQGIRRSYELPSFPASLSFVNRVASCAEAMNHHPEILIQYDRVTLTVMTHSEKGITEKDFALAKRIDAG